ncbi:OLC1v1005091C1 [Oldenlandia corymbosa var. corymbosa]|uniref:OLC1v1005091C1 n=1 Tax=Oldenlandia corymbosa var. corymbosa TaxID=529605 RepID=A0AAV1DF45_OLDCO|nr:OLC1v1005091C1 [Oldenlandia corymbosa var. corymbosa]
MTQVKQNTINDVASQIKPLQKKMFPKEGCPPALLDRGRKIAEERLIVIVGGILSNMEPHTWEEVARSLRKESKLLRVLDLREIYFGSFFPIEVGLFGHLRYLALATAWLTPETQYNIPPSIDNLSNLETFVVEGRHTHVLLPNTVWNMRKLRHLCTTGELAWLEFPKEC